MSARVLLATLTAIAFLFAVSTQDLRAAAATGPGTREWLHVVAKGELHDAVSASSAETAAARKTVQDFLARPEVRNQIERMGFDPAVVASRVALLSDSDLLRLNGQVMEADQQMRTAGIPTWAIVLIIVGVVLGVLMILAYYLIDD